MTTQIASAKLAPAVAKSEPPPRSRRRANRAARAPKTAITLTLWLYALISVGPFIVMVLNSFRTHLEMVTDPIPLPRSFTLDNYSRAWIEADFGTYAFNSLFVTIGAVALSTAVSLPAAYAIARWRFRLAGVLESVFLSGLMIPIILAILPIFHLVDSLGLIDSQLSLILIYGANGVPFTVFVLVSFFRQLPGELEEAATIDGAGPFRTFAVVMLPLVKPAVATVVVFRFVPIWNDFLFPLILLRSSENYTIGVGLTRFMGEYYSDRAALFAGLTIATVPLIILFIVATRQIVNGLTAGLGK